MQEKEEKKKKQRSEPLPFLDTPLCEPGGLSLMERSRRIAVTVQNHFVYKMLESSCGCLILW